MNQRLALRALVAVVLGASASSLSAQTPFEKDISVDWLVPSGLPSPASLARDPSTGVIFASSLFNKNGPGKKTDIHRVQPDGTVELFTNPLHDPDVLAMDSSGFIYVGAYSGRITRIDPVSGAQTVWVHDGALGNVDGLAFRADGDLLVSAIDHSRIHLVDGTTQTVTEFADLDSLNAFGFGSIALHGSAVYVAAPKDGFIAQLDGDGSITNGSFRSGFAHVGQLAVDGDILYASDNPAGAICKIDLTGAGPDSILVLGIPEYSGGFLAVGNGDFYGSWQAGDLSDGGIYRIRPMTLSMAQPPAVGGTWELDLDSPSDAGRGLFTILGITTGDIPLPDGRSIPANLVPGTYLFLRGSFDADGHWDLDFAVPDNNLLADLTVWANSISMQDGFFAISSALPITILP